MTIVLLWARGVGDLETLQRSRSYCSGGVYDDHSDRRRWVRRRRHLGDGRGFSQRLQIAWKFWVCLVREIIAKRIIDAAKNGERDPARLYEQALIPFGIEDMSMLVVSVGRDLPVPAYASVTQAA